MLWWQCSQYCYCYIVTFILLAELLCITYQNQIIFFKICFFYYSHCLRVTMKVFIYCLWNCIIWIIYGQAKLMQFYLITVFHFKVNMSFWMHLICFKFLFVGKLLFSCCLLNMLLPKMLIFRIFLYIWIIIEIRYYFWPDNSF